MHWVWIGFCIAVGLGVAYALLLALILVGGLLGAFIKDHRKPIGYVVIIGGAVLYIAYLSNGG